jgi:hypothetical protein
MALNPHDTKQDIPRAAVITILIQQLTHDNEEPTALKVSFNNQFEAVTSFVSELVNKTTMLNNNRKEAGVLKYMQQSITQISLHRLMTLSAGKNINNILSFREGFKEPALHPAYAAVADAIPLMFSPKDEREWKEDFQQCIPIGDFISDFLSKKIHCKNPLEDVRYAATNTVEIGSLRSVFTVHHNRLRRTVVLSVTVSIDASFEPNNPFNVIDIADLNV